MKETREKKGKSGMYKVTGLGAIKTQLGGEVSIGATKLLQILTEKAIR